MIAGLRQFAGFWSDFALSRGSGFRLESSLNSKFQCLTTPVSCLAHQARKNIVSLLSTSTALIVCTAGTYRKLNITITLTIHLTNIFAGMTIAKNVPIATFTS